MLYAIALIVSKICFALIVVIWKQLRKRGVSTVSNLSLFSFSIPVLSLLGLFLYQTNDTSLSTEYLCIVGLWLMPVFLSNVFDVYLLRYQSLTEQTSYKLTAATLIALVIDILFFETKYSLLIIISSLLFLIGGMLLTKNKPKVLLSLSLPKVLFLVTLIAALDVAAYAFYKQGLLLQESLLFHIAISQSILFFTFLLIGFKNMSADLRAKKIYPTDIVRLNLLILIYLVLEAIVVKGLPLIIVVSTSVLSLAIYLLFDLRFKEFKISSKSVFALLLITLGIVLLGVAT